MKKIISIAAICLSLAACGTQKAPSVSGEFTPVNYDLYKKNRFDFNHRGSVVDAAIKLERIAPSVIVMQPKGVISNRQINLKLKDADIETVLQELKNSSEQSGVALINWEQSINKQYIPLYIDFNTNTSY